MIGIKLKRKDCLARICEVTLDDEAHETPVMIDFLKKDDIPPHIKPDKIPLALIEFEELKRSYKIHEILNKDILILTGFNVLSPKKLTESILKIKIKNPSKPIYAPALATPNNVLMLFYLGVDIVDNILPIIKAHLGVYMLPDCELKLDSLKTLPCRCEICKRYNIDELISLDHENRSLLLAKHNTYVLEEQVNLAKQLIHNGTLREILESRARVSPGIAAMLRLSDEIAIFKHECPRFRRSKVLLFKDSYTRPEIRNFFERAIDVYSPKTKAVVLLPCTATKPYFTSKTHKIIRKHVRILVNEIIISSPLVVPREMELLYPANNYDVPVTGIWDEDEIKFVASKLASFLKKGNFEKIIAHVEGGYKKVVELASEMGGFDVFFTCNGSVLSKEALNNLKKEVEPYNDDYFNFKVEIFKHMVKYQFSIDFTFKKCNIKGKYPKMQLFRNEELLLRVDTNYGMLDIYRHFAEELINRNIYFVKIHDFEPKGTIFSGGIIEAYEKIRVNDIIAFYNSRLIGVGRSLMSGKDINEKINGNAVEVKRKWKI